MNNSGLVFLDAWENWNFRKFKGKYRMWLNIFVIFKDIDTGWYNKSYGVEEVNNFVADR